MSSTPSFHPVNRLAESLVVEPLGDDRFRGSTPQTTLQRTFGGLVAAQGLLSGVATVEEPFSVHSLHGYFIRPGIPDEPITFAVDRVRDGRSFSLRSVTGLQRDKVMFSMTASFHVPQGGLEHQNDMPQVPTPDELPENDFPEEFSEFLGTEWPDWDVRLVPAADTPLIPGVASRQMFWFRHRHALPEDPHTHVAALTYMSDMTLISVAWRPHVGTEAEGASLDHALWFLRPFRADGWLLYDQSSPSAHGGRGLARGSIFDPQGRMVASVTQEGLMRTSMQPIPGT
ncbi:acyl-CoA thioesterase [Kribbia dieselivorans]|uniref:acyl-CoA thioesterase n=1 Tax=Kribbia dieselivorans TaxID=331526 RepID=UPI0008384031|nr:acyl-CoA thioesterase II [Kribbia dieselivorans]